MPLPEQNQAINDNTLCVAGCVVITRQEVTEALDLRVFIDAKADAMRESFKRSIIDDINRRGWALVEYAVNTTGLEE